jgi:peptidoglycan hydrolase-like protein with peptidoglycan-binding domain
MTARLPRKRHALWALLALPIAALALASAITSAHAASGGISRNPPGGADASDEGAAFGSRVLREGMQGEDVKILNGIVTSKTYARGVRVTDTFESPTARAVRAFQRNWSLSPSGVVTRTTAKALVHSMKITQATWYGPGLYGAHTACGQTLRSTTIGVANRTLPCGTKVTFAYHGRFVIAPVIDRGPYGPAGRDFDLTWATRQALHFGDVDEIRYAAAR